MAHLVVCRETIIENVPASKETKTLSIGKHPRTSYQSNDALQCGVIGAGSKRRALGSITNTLVPSIGSGYPPSKPGSLHDNIQCNVTTSLGNVLLEPPTIYSNSTATHVSQEQDRKFSTSIALSASFSLSNSLLSFGSPGSFGSPMVLSPTISGQREVDLAGDANCIAIGEYAKDIFLYLREAEVRFQPKVDYIQKQPDITHGMRCILVDWLVEVCEEFKLEQQTLYLGVSIVDRFLSLMSVQRSKLQLVGAASMFLAAKFEEIYPPEVGDFVYITDDTYTKLQIARMEAVVLKALSFNLLSPTILTFLQRYLSVAEAEQTQAGHHGRLGNDPNLLTQCSELAMYLCELALLNGDPYLKYQPSVVAASSLCLARHTLLLEAWTGCLQYYSGYTVSDISNCVQDLHRTFAMAPAHPQQAIRIKYNCDKYQKVSTLKAPETLPC